MSVQLPAGGRADEDINGGEVTAVAERLNDGGREDVSVEDESTRELAQNPDSIAANIERGVARYQAGDLSGALADLNTAVSACRARMEQAFKEVSEDMGDGGREVWNRAMQKRREVLWYRPRAFEFRAHTRRRLGEPQGAVEDYTELIADERTRADLYMCRGVARSESGDVEGALADYSEAILRDPACATAYYNRARERGIQGDLDGALADAAIAIDLNPTKASVYANRAIVWRKKGDLAAAIADSSRAIELDPTCAAAYAHRAAVHLDNGDLTAAEADVRRAVELKPKDPAIRAIWRAVAAACGLPTESASEPRTPPTVAEPELWQE